MLSFYCHPSGHLPTTKFHVIDQVLKELLKNLKLIEKSIFNDV